MQDIWQKEKWQTGHPIDLYPNMSYIDAYASPKLSIYNFDYRKLAHMFQLMHTDTTACYSYAYRRFNVSNYLSIFCFIVHLCFIKLLISLWHQLV